MPKDQRTDANVFYADNRFERMARRPGAPEPEKALEAAHAHLEELHADFADWINNELAQLSSALAQLEAKPSDLGSIERAFHSCAHLRDVGATMGFELVTFVAANLCDVIDAMKAGAAYDKNTLTCHIDALNLAKTERYRHLRPEQVPEMTSGLRRIGEIASIVPDDSGR